MYKTKIFFLIILSFFLFFHNVIADDGKSSLSEQERQQLVDNYRNKLWQQINGQRGIEVYHMECSLTGLILFMGEIMLAFIGEISLVGSSYSTAITMSLIMASANDVACWWSVVRNPVEVFPEVINPNNNQLANTGKYKKIAQQNSSSVVYEATDNYDEAVRADMSDYLTICQRLPLPLNVFSPNSLTEEEKSLKDNDTLRWLLERSGNLECKKGKAGENVWINSTKFGIYQSGNMLCAKIKGAFGIDFTWPENIVGCHKTPISGIAPMCASSVPITNSNNIIIDYDNSSCYSCYIAESCYDKRLQIGHAPLPMSSTLIQCFLETLTIIITGSTRSAMTACSASGLLYAVQLKLYNALKALITLYITLYGIRIMLGQEAPKKQEAIMAFLKIAIVLYFTAPTNGGMRVYYGVLQDITVGIADMLISSAGNETVCNYDVSSYQVPTTSGANIGRIKSIPQIALWDRFDCRVYYYLGAPAINLKQVADQQVQSKKAFHFLMIIIPALLGGQIIVLIAALIIAFVVTTMIIWAIQIYLLSALAMAVIVVISPIFIPMVLFGYTKPFFDNWLKELIAYTLYPALLIGYIGFFFTVIDDIYFGDLRFQQHKSTQTSHGHSREIIDFVLSDTNSNYDKYSSDYFDGDAPLMIGVMDGLPITSKLLGGFLPFSSIPNIAVRILYPLLKMALALIMFMFFNKIIVTIVGELSGGSRSAIEMGGSAMDPATMIQKGIETAAPAVRKAKAMAQMAQQKLKGAVPKSGGDGGGGGGGSGNSQTTIRKPK